MLMSIFIGGEVEAKLGRSEGDKILVKVAFEILEAGVVRALLGILKGWLQGN